MDGCTFTFKEIEDHVAKVKQKALISAMRNNPVYGPFSDALEKCLLGLSKEYVNLGGTFTFKLTYKDLRGYLGEERFKAEALNNIDSYFVSAIKIFSYFYGVKIYSVTIDNDLLNSDSYLISVSMGMFDELNVHYSED